MAIGMRRTIDERLVKESFRYDPGSGLVYLNNPKAGCSSIKESLWKKADAASGHASYCGNPHDMNANPFVKNVFARESFDHDRLKSATFFSAVRNPFARALSAYLDKIAPQDCNVVRTEFCKRFAVPATEPVSFRSFLDIVASEKPELLDAHFRPQHLNLLMTVCRPHFIGCIEAPAGLSEFLGKFGIELHEHRFHATAAGNRLGEFYSAEEVELVRRIYAEDFGLFGYASDISHVEESPAGLAREGGCESLLDWICDGNFPFALVDVPTAEFYRFRAARTPAAKFEILRGATAGDDSWMRLRVYAEFALRINEYDLARDLIDRVASLRNASHVRDESESPQSQVLPEAR